MKFTSDAFFAFIVMLAAHCVRHVHTVVSEELVDFKRALDDAAEALQDVKETAAISGNAMSLRQRRNTIDELLANYQSNLNLDLEREALNLDEYDPNINNMNKNFNSNSNNNIINYNELLHPLQYRACKQKGKASSNAIPEAASPSAPAPVTSSGEYPKKINLNDELNELVRVNSRFQNLHKQLLNSFHNSNRANIVSTLPEMSTRSSDSKAVKGNVNTNTKSSSSDTSAIKSDKSKPPTGKSEKPSGTVETSNSNTKGKAQSYSNLNDRTFSNPNANSNSNSGNSYNFNSNMETSYDSNDFSNINSNQNPRINYNSNSNSNSDSNSNSNSDTNSAPSYDNDNVGTSSHRGTLKYVTGNNGGLSGGDNGKTFINCRPMAGGVGASSSSNSQPVSSTYLKFSADSDIPDLKAATKGNSKGKLNTILLLEADTIRNSLRGKNKNDNRNNENAVSNNNYLGDIHYNGNNNENDKNNKNNNNVHDQRGWIDSYDFPRLNYDFDYQKPDDKADDDVITYEKTIENIHFPSIVNDQFDLLRNDLSHEANYKLSKIEQDQAERGRAKPMPRQNQVQAQPLSPQRGPSSSNQQHLNSNQKRSTGFNALDEIKLKTSTRLMRKGLGPSLPSYALSDTQRELKLDDEVKRLEEEYDAAPKHEEYDKYESMLSVDERQWQDRLKRLEDLEQRSLDQVLSGGIPELSVEKDKPTIDKVDEILLDPTFEIMRAKRVTDPKDDDREMPQKTIGAESENANNGASGDNSVHNIGSGGIIDADDEISVLQLPNVVKLGSAEFKANGGSRSSDLKLSSQDDNDDMRNAPILEVGAAAKMKRSNGAKVNDMNVHNGQRMIYKLKRGSSSESDTARADVPKRRVKRIGVINEEGEITSISELDMDALLGSKMPQQQQQQPQEWQRKRREVQPKAKSEASADGSGRMAKRGVLHRRKRSMPVLAEEIFEDDSMHTLEESRVKRSLRSIAAASESQAARSHGRARRDTAKALQTAVQITPPAAQLTPKTKVRNTSPKEEDKRAIKVPGGGANAAVAAKVAAGTDSSKIMPHVMEKRATPLMDETGGGKADSRRAFYPARLATDSGSNNYIDIDDEDDDDIDVDVDGDVGVGGGGGGDASAAGDDSDSINVGGGDVMHEYDYNDPSMRRKRIANEELDFTAPASEFGAQRFDNLRQRDEHARKFDGLKVDNLWYNDDTGHNGNNNRREDERYSHEDSGNAHSNFNKNNKHPHKAVMTIAIENGAIKSIGRNCENSPYDDASDGMSGGDGGSCGMGWGDDTEGDTPSEDLPPRTQKQGLRGSTDKGLVVALKDQVLNCTAFSSLENFLRTLQQQNKSGGASGDDDNGGGSNGGMHNTSNPNEGEINTDIQINPVTPRPFGSSSNGGSNGDSNGNGVNGKHKPMKLNITISASVTGDQKAKNFIGNGTIKVQSEERERRGISFGQYDRFTKRKCPHPNKPLGESSSLQEDGPTGKGSLEVVKSLLGLVKCNPQLKVLWPSLRRNQMCLANMPRQMSAISKMPKDETSRIEDMMESAMEAINEMIENQVETRSCVPLRSDLKEFYEKILGMYKQDDDMTRTKRDNLVSLSDEFSKEVRLIDPNKVDERSRIVKKLLRQYDDLPMEDQQQMVGIRNDLIQNLDLLRQIQAENGQQQQQAECGDDAQTRRRRELLHQLDTKQEDLNLMKQYNLDYTPQYLRLLKATELMQEANMETQQPQSNR